MGRTNKAWERFPKGWMESGKGGIFCRTPTPRSGPGDICAWSSKGNLALAVRHFLLKHREDFPDIAREVETAFELSVEETKNAKEVESMHVSRISPMISRASNQENSPSEEPFPVYEDEGDNIDDTALLKPLSKYEPEEQNPPVPVPSFPAASRVEGVWKFACFQCARSRASAEDLAAHQVAYHSLEVGKRWLCGSCPFVGVSFAHTLAHALLEAHTLHKDSSSPGSPSSPTIASYDGQSNLIGTATTFVTESGSSSPEHAPTSVTQFGPSLVPINQGGTKNVDLFASETQFSESDFKKPNKQTAHCVSESRFQRPRGWEGIVFPATDGIDCGLQPRIGESKEAASRIGLRHASNGNAAVFLLKSTSN